MEGYEIHLGETTLSPEAWLEITNRNGEAVRILDGAMSLDGQISGCYLHGIFANTNFRQTWLANLGWRQGNHHSPANPVDQSLGVLADAVEGSLRMDLLEKIIWEK